MALQLAPPWRVSNWLNTDRPLSLESLRGRVVFLHAFQMLCPGCVSRAIPQAQRVADVFSSAPLSVVGIHTVFEHHDAMQEVSLRAFLHEYAIAFPVGIDRPSSDGSPIPQTMRSYAMQGTPTAILIDRDGYIRSKKFGVQDDLSLGAEIAALLGECTQA